VTALAAVLRPGGPAPLEACQRILAAQAVYGRLPPATWSGDIATLGQRLFPLLPQDRFSPGPVALAGGGAIVADVRLDNREEIAGQLGLTPAAAGALSDCAILARAWDSWGEGLLDRIVGDFAFALWDAREARLVLARDAFGQRPLHIHQGHGFVAVSSMPMGIFAVMDSQPVPNESRLADLLALNAEDGPASFFEGIDRIEPGAVVSIGDSGVRARRWYAPPRRPVRLAGPDSYVEALREHLDRAVSARLRGAGALVGSHLSSGWDSSAVAVTAARLSRPGGGRVAAFTSAPREGYDGPDPPYRRLDESAIAAEVAAGEPNIEHVLVRGCARSPLEPLDRLSVLCGRPVVSPCNQVWLDEICRRAAAMGVSVLLTGDLGNESLSDTGMGWLADLAHGGRWLAWARAGGRALAAGTMRPAGLLRVSLAEEPDSSLSRWLRRRRGEWVGPRGAHSALTAQRYRQVRRPFPGRDSFEQRLAAATAIDRGPINKGVLAAFGVDLRAPLMDRRLVEFCLNLPGEEVMRGGRRRDLARRALADRLPPMVLDEARTGYQGGDWHEGLSAAEVGAEIERLAQVPMAARLVDVARLRRLVSDWPAGGWNDGRVQAEYRLALLRGLAVGRFVGASLRPNV
jgi:asparagine synthase (glutamine-hydrolysing)